MTNHNSDKDGTDALVSELKLENEKLRQRVKELEDKQQALAEMEANYPHFRRIVYAKLREEFAESLRTMPDMDLEELAKLEGGQPLESFIDQIFGTAGEP